MKALIMANLGNVHYYNGEVLPTCFLPLYNKMTIIDRQISLLNINGISNDKICVLCGDNGIWNVGIVRNRLIDLGVKLIFNSKSNYLKEGIFEDSFFDDDILILEGNKIIDIAIISRLLRYRQDNVLVISELASPDKEEYKFALMDNDVKSIRNADVMSFPWYAFSGVAKLSEETLNVLKEKTLVSRPLLDAIDDILSLSNFKAIKYDDLVYGRLNGGHSSELTGGSYSKLNYRLVVKKESDDEGRDKLINEIKWLLSIPKELKPYFSEVLEYDIESKKVFYNVPYYGSRNLRENIFDGHLDSDSTCLFLEKLLDWMFENVYSRKISEATDNWIMEKHIIRVLDRLPECAEKSKELGEIIDAKRVVINGVEYRNIRELFTELAKMKEMQKELTPKELVMIHGDLHFQNILLYNETDTGFMLVDPRGESMGSDIYYDLGKLWHSFHAKYDFIHSDQFKYSIEWNGEVPSIQYSITNVFAEKVYDEIYEKFPKIITKYDFIRNDPNWEMKILFAEASHLCSVSTFHIHKTKTPERAIVMYLIGVVLINEFFDKYIV